MGQPRRGKRDARRKRRAGDVARNDQGGKTPAASDGGAPCDRYPACGCVGTCDAANWPRARRAQAGAETAEGSDATRDAASTDAASGGEKEIVLGHGTVSDDAQASAPVNEGLAEMLEEASAALNPPADEGAQTQRVETATVTLSAETFPGLCMGASMLMSLAMAKAGYGPLTDVEGKALTDALLKNAMAWDLGGIIGNPRVAAAVDLGGVLIAIMTPRIINELRAAPSPTQARAAEGDDQSPAP